MKKVLAIEVKMKIFSIMLLVAILICSMVSCSKEDDYVVGSGTASRADISYPDPVQSGMQFESSLVISGDSIVSN